MYIEIKAMKIHFVRLNPALRLQCTLQNTIYKANENEIHVKQYAKQMKTQFTCVPSHVSAENPNCML